MVLGTRTYCELYGAGIVKQWYKGWKIPRYNPTLVEPRPMIFDPSWTEMWPEPTGCWLFWKTDRLYIPWMFCSLTWSYWPETRPDLNWRSGTRFWLCKESVYWVVAVSVCTPCWLWSVSTRTHRLCRRLHNSRCCWHR